MVKGTVVVNKEGQYLIFLSMIDEIANCAVIEYAMDEYQGEEVARVVALQKFPITELIVAEKYPRCIQQINVS